MKREYDLVVIGAGAAGMLCAGTAAEEGLSVLLLEKNHKVGRKLLITGKGRCNVTNNCDEDSFLKAVRRNPPVPVQRHQPVQYSGHYGVF